MQSKRSFFNRTLFRKNLGRFWPLWGAASLMGAMAPLYLLLNLFSVPHGPVEPEEFARLLYMTVTAVVPAATLCYAMLTAMTVWSYLYSPRSVGLMHTLPIDRTGLFVTNALSGLAMMLIPYAVTGGLLCLIALAWHFFDLVAVVSTVLAVLLMTVLFFGLATLCAMAVGHLAALPAVYLLLNFLAPALDLLFSGLAQEFLLGFREGYSGKVDFLSPVMQIYKSFSYTWETGPLPSDQVYLQGLWVVALYGLAGLVMLALAWALYRARKSESAGDVVAFRWLRPVFRYGVALLSALTLGRLLYGLFWSALFQKGDYADPAPMAVCMAFTGLLGYYAASMLLEKSLRVFRSGWKGALAVCAGAALVCALISGDVFGVESRVPRMDQIESVELNCYFLENSAVLSAQEDPELVGKVLSLHQAIVDDAAYIRSFDSSRVTTEASSDEEPQYYWGYFYLTYTLSDGSQLHRSYSLPITRARVQEAGSYDQQLLALCGDPLLQVKAMELPAGSRLSEVYFFNYAAVAQTDGAVEDAQVLYDALLEDARSGNLRLFSFEDLEAYGSGYEYCPGEINIEYRISGSSGYYFQYKIIQLRPTMTNTLAVLLDMGFLTEEALSDWNDSLEEACGEEARLPETVDS